ncbi:WD repeat-containing protein 6-like [Physella acuta]|uniref:WD repeat-containing protein 6-like n=1 Tax=Physella acuta TaxID=109671 RepID=UPI0027DD8634|nr:WD repeat-containing protein 6-like [Physella acuta]
MNSFECKTSITLIKQSYVGPVTAVDVFGDTIICGYGNEISVYNLTTCELQVRQQVLTESTIHGIKRGPVIESGQLFCVYGGKQACVISLSKSKEGNQVITSVSETVFLCDLIWNAQWLTNQLDFGKVAFALAHNLVVKWDWQLNKVSQGRQCTENCILYCASFIGDVWNNLILAAGTVFNQIVLWPVDSEGEVDSGVSGQHPVETMQVLSGHKGVIFSISYHAGHRRICSASDDRSILMWQLSFPCVEGQCPTVDDWRSMQSSLMFCLYGHSARVWKVVLMDNYFVSVGEDATCFVWNYSGNVMSTLKGHKGKSIWSLAVTEDEKFVITGGGDASIRKWQVHQHKKTQSQRSVQVPVNCRMNEEDFPRIVRLLNYDTLLVMMNSGCLYSYKVNDQRFTLIIQDAKFRSYSVVSPCIDQKSFVIGSITGTVRVMRYADIDSDEITFAEETYFEGKVLNLTWLNNDHFIASGPDGHCILIKIDVVENNDGTSLNLIVQHRMFLPTSKHRWISAACPLSNQFTADIHNGTLVCGDKDGSIHVFTLDQHEINDDTYKQEPSQSFTRVHGKAGVTFVTFRDGFVYTAGRDGFYRQWQFVDGKLVLLHGNKIIKGFEWIDKLAWHNGDLLVYGFFSCEFVVWSVTYNQQLMSIYCGGGHRTWGCIHENGMLRFAYIKASNIFMVDTGSQAKQTIVQPACHGRELCDVKFLKSPFETQGQAVHLVCSASEDTTVNIGMFISILYKADLFSPNHILWNCNNFPLMIAYKKLFYTWTPLTTLKGHHSSVRCLAVSDTTSSCNNEVQLESLKALDAAINESTTFLLFTGGGRAEIRAWKIKLFKQSQILKKTSNVNNKSWHSKADQHTECAGATAPVLDSEACECSGVDSGDVGCTYEHLSTHFLGEARHKQHFSSWKTRKLRLDPETRVMSLSASSVVQLLNQGSNVLKESSHQVSHLHILSAAGSDGVYRVFSFDESLKKFSLLVATDYHRGCMLKVLHYVHTTPGNLALPFSLTVSTNGQIVIWSLDTVVMTVLKSCEAGKGDDDEAEDYVDFTQPVASKAPWEPVAVLKAHQSGINSLHTLQISDSCMLVASGGDDNAIAVHKLQLPDLKVLAKVVKPDAHAAQITGIWLVSPGLLVSASIDQRIIVWAIDHSIQSTTIQLQILSSNFIHVANVSSMDVKLHRDSVYLCIAGEGITLYKLNQSSNDGDGIRDSCTSQIQQSNY